MHLCFLDSFFTRSRVSNTCSGDLSRFGKLVDLHTENFSSKLLHCLFLNFSVNLVFVEKICVMVFWKFGKTRKSPLSQKFFLEMYFFFYCLWNVKFLHNLTYHIILPSLNWNFSIGEGNCTPLQYSCLENPMDRRAWWVWSMGSLGVGHDWATLLSLFTFMHWRRKWQPTPVFLPGESQGFGSLVGCCLWGRTESDMTEAT